MLLLIAATAAVAAVTPTVNLALHHPYLGNCSTLTGWTGLVDGIKDSDTAPGCFATTNEHAYPKFVVIDLGAECQISKVIVYNSGNGNTRTVSLASSTDGSNYKKLRDPDFIFGPEDDIALTVSFKARQARYVRLTLPDTWKGGLGGDNCLFLREVEVYGARTGPELSTDPFLQTGQQPITVNTRAASIFKRYCLDNPGELRIAVVGDWMAAGAGEGDHWSKVLAAELNRQYPEKKITLTGVGGTDGAIAFGLQWAKDNHASLAPDIVILAYGSQAALAGAEVKEFRLKYQALVTELIENTGALIIALTPPPFLQEEKLPLFARVKGRNTRPYAYAVEEVALSRSLSLVRSASALAKAPGDKRGLYQDNLHLSEAGQRLLGQALMSLLY
jgi:lysophospholipase L1-like esterase